MQLAVVVDQLALVVDDDARVPRHAERVVLHDGEAAPNGVLRAGGAEGGDFGPGQGAHELWAREHGEPVDAVFGEDDQVHLRVGGAGFAD